MENLEKPAENLESTETAENIEIAEDAGNLAEPEVNWEEMGDGTLDFLDVLDAAMKKIEKNIEEDAKKQLKGPPAKWVGSTTRYNRLLPLIEKGEQPYKKPGKFFNLINKIYDGEYNNKAEAEKKWRALSQEDKRIKIAEDLVSLIYNTVPQKYDGFFDIETATVENRTQAEATKFRIEIYNHLKKGTIYKDIKKLINAISRAPTDFYFCIPLREATATLITRMIEVDANHGASPKRHIRRIGRAARRAFEKLQS